MTSMKRAITSHPGRLTSREPLPSADLAQQEADLSPRPASEERGASAPREKTRAGRARPRSETTGSGGDRLSPNARARLRLFGRNLRAARVFAELSQRELHERSGVAQSHISELERALTIPKLDTISDLADVLGVDFVDLLSPSPKFEGYRSPRRRGNR